MTLPSRLRDGISYLRAFAMLRNPEHLGAVAQDHLLDALFAARAALKRAYAVRSASELQVSSCARSSIGSRRSRVDRATR